MGTTSQGSRQAKQAAESPESDSVAASISVLFRNRAPEHHGDDLDDGWGGEDDEGSSPSAVAVKLPAAALAPARVPSFIPSAFLPGHATSEWPGAPLSRTPTVPEDESDWDLPASTGETTATSSCVRELAPSSWRESARADNGRGGSTHGATSAEQVPCASADSSARHSLCGPESAVSAPAIDITIEPSFRGTMGESKHNADSGSCADLSEVLSGPRSSRSAVARNIERSTGGPSRGRLVAAVVMVVALGGATYLALRGTSPALFRAQDPAATAPIPLLPHLAIPNPPNWDLPTAAVKPAIEAAKPVTGDSLESRQAGRSEIKPVTRRRVRTVVSRPPPVEAAAPLAPVIAEPAAAQASATPPVGVVDLMIAAPAPKAAEPLQPAPVSRPGGMDEPPTSHLNK